MTYELEEWDYDIAEDIERVVKYFRENKRLLVLIDRDKDKSFILVGDCENKELDMKQGKALLSFVNSPEFPSD